MSGLLEVLSTQGADRQLWQQAVSVLPAHQQDTFFLPQYAALYEGVTHEPAFLFRYGNEKRGVVMAGVKRSVNRLPFWKSDVSHRSYYDMASPYGYGGPLVYGHDPAELPDLFASFREALHDYCLKEGIVAEFLRLHPLIRNHELFGQDEGLYQKNSTVWIDLRRTAEDILGGMRSDHQRNVGKAVRKGVEIVYSDMQADDVKEFHRLYSMTMERLEALPMFFFPLAFFEEAADQLKGHVSCFLAKWNGKVISAHLVLHRGHYIHNYLSGSDSEFRNLKPDVLITYKIALWAKARGYQFFHLGGGHACAVDSVFAFKSGFSPLRSSYYMYRHVHDPAAYTGLCAARKEFEQRASGVRSADPIQEDYFPFYRAGLPSL